MLTPEKRTSSKRAQKAGEEKPFGNQPSAALNKTVSYTTYKGFKKSSTTKKNTKPSSSSTKKSSAPHECFVCKQRAYLKCPECKVVLFCSSEHF